VFGESSQTGGAQTDLPAQAVQPLLRRKRKPLANQIHKRSLGFEP
jgi:hypothetical protein